MSDHSPLPGEAANCGVSSQTHSAKTPGIRRLALRTGMLAAGLGCVLLATSQGRPDFITTRLGFPVLTAEGKTSTELANLAGFQRRGNTLVGEVRTREGATMRLVFDARTHTLIGFRIMDQAETTPREPELLHPLLLGSNKIH